MSFKNIFPMDKPIIAMVHFPPLPGTPLFKKDDTLESIIESTRKDLVALQNAGVDAVMFGNENDRPYELNVNIASTTTMAYVIGNLKKDINIPFGVNVLWDAISTIALAAATGASFAREIFTGTYASDMGFWNPDAGKAVRYKKSLERDNLVLLYNISAEFAYSMDKRTLAERAKSVVFSSIPDALLVSGPLTGVSTSIDELKAVKDIVRDVPVLANTGVNISNVKDILEVADGVVIGSSLKVNGDTWKAVDENRAKKFMDEVNKIRKK